MHLVSKNYQNNKKKINLNEKTINSNESPKTLLHPNIIEIKDTSFFTIDTNNTSEKIINNKIDFTNSKNSEDSYKKIPNADINCE